MGKFSVKAKAEEVKTGFESYDGPEPKSGMHRAVIKNLRFKKFSTGSHGFVVLTELEAAKGDPRGHKNLDGWPDFTNVVAVPADGEPMKEGSQRGLSNFLAAIGVGDDPDIVTEDGDLTKGVKLKKIGSKLITGIEGKTVVTVDIGSEDYQGETRMRVRNLFKAKDDAKAVSAEVEDDEAEEAEDESVDEDDEAVAEREAELGKLTLVKLRAEAKTAGLTAADIKGLGKDELISAILDEEFGVEEDEEEAEDDEADADVEAEEEDEAEEEEEEAEEEEEEEEEDDSERRAELEALTRPKLIAAAKAAGGKPLKKHSDADLVDIILAAEAGDDEVPF
jgi:hypothetical protein